MAPFLASCSANVRSEGPHVGAIALGRGSQLQNSLGKRGRRA